MRILITTLILMLFIGCNVRSESVAEVQKPIQNQSILGKTEENSKSIYKVDFRNFTYPWTEKLGDVGKTFTLENGEYSGQEGRVLSLQSINYEDAKSENDEKEALVTICIDEGNATYKILYIYEFENNKPKLIQSFEFAETNSNFATIFVAHGELIIETYNVLSSNAQCCPSTIERLHYKWKEDKFVLIETQKIANSYVERAKK